MAKLDVVVRACSFNTKEIEAEGSEFEVRWAVNKILSQKQNKNERTGGRAQSVTVLA
jgi:hypothetical protein